MTATPLILSDGPMTLHLAPTLGGGVRSLTHDGVGLLRPAPDGADSPLQLAAFPMIPFSGRIRDGHLRVGGLIHQLEATLPPEPHAIHGFGWRAAWTVASHTASSAVLRYAGGGVGWPWRHTARQTFSLTPRGLTLTLSVTNRGNTPMPAGLGWHPYFPRADAQLQAATTHIWPTRGGIPQSPEPVDAASDLRTLRPVDGLSLDHPFTLSHTTQRMVWPDRTLTMTADSLLSTLVVYVPSGEDFFCVEPASHIPDAISRAEGMAMLPPGETMAATVRLVVER